MSPAFLWVLLRSGRAAQAGQLYSLIGKSGRRQPGEIGGIGPIDPDPEANTPGRYQLVT